MPSPNPVRASVVSRRLEVVGTKAWVAAAALLLSLAWVSSAAAQIPVTAAWDANVDALTSGYRVFVGTSPGTVLAVIDVGRATSVVLPLPPGNTYYVSVRGYTARGDLGPASAEAVVDLESSPGAPTSVRASVTGATANLNWEPPASGGIALNYLLSVGTASGASNVLSEYSVGGVLGVSGALPPGTYFARLQARNMVGVGPPSAEVAIQVGGATPPGAPRSLAGAVAGSRVTLTWAASPGGADSYVVEAGTVSGAANVGSLNVGGTTSFAVDAPAGTYFVRVRAVRGSGISAPSNEVVVRPR